MRRYRLLVAVTLQLTAASPLCAKDVAHKLGVGASASTSGVGTFDLRYSLKQVEIVFGLDLDLTKLSGKSVSVDVGIDLAFFIKVVQGQYVNAGPVVGATLGVRDDGNGLSLHPQVRAGFTVMWFPDGGNYLALFLSADLNVNIVLSDGPIFTKSAVNPGAKGFGLGLTPNLRAGFVYYF